MYYKLLKTNETIPEDRCRLQLIRLIESLKEKLPLVDKILDKVFQNCYKPTWKLLNGNVVKISKSTWKRLNGKPSPAVVFTRY